MINLITSRDYKEEKYPGINIHYNTDAFESWWSTYEGKLQVDTETNIVVGVYGYKGHLKGINKTFTEDYDENGNRIPLKRECYVVQLGDETGDVQWIFDIPELKQQYINVMLMVLKSDREKLLHNALFDYTTIKWCFGVEIKHILDTFLMSQIVNSGFDVGDVLPKGYHSLVSCAKRYLNIDLSKASQTSFNGKPLTLKQIEYAASDVAVLGPIYEKLNEEVEKWELYNTVALEQSVLRSYGDSMCENLYLNTQMWSDTMHNQEKEVIRISNEFFKLLEENLEKFISETRVQLDSINKEEEPAEYIRVKNKYNVVTNLVSTKDQYNFKWSSSKTKATIMKHLYPGLPENTSTIKDYKIFYNNNIDSEGYEGTSLEYINLLLNRDFSKLETYLIKNHSELLIDLEIYIPKGTILMNLNSSQQKLGLFQCIDDSIESTNKEVISKIDHPLAYKLKEYNKAAKMATSYGQNFLDAVNPDGMFRVSGYKQILSTGRSSMDKLQLLPGTSLYRNPFQPNNPKTGTRDDGYKWVVVGADYASQEAVVAATFCKEDSLLKAIEEGCDFHSTCAALMFPDEWKRLGGDPKPKGKPEDKTLQKLRNNSKVTSFGK